MRRKKSGRIGRRSGAQCPAVDGDFGRAGIASSLQVAKGSLVNKLILVGRTGDQLYPSAGYHAFLLVGGLYLCFEGVEKLAHRFLHSHHEDEQHHQE